MEAQGPSGVLDLESEEKSIINRYEYYYSVELETRGQDVNWVLSQLSALLGSSWCIV